MATLPYRLVEAAFPITNQTKILEVPSDTYVWKIVSIPEDHREGDSLYEVEDVRLANRVELNGRRYRFGYSQRYDTFVYASEVA